MPDKNLELHILNGLSTIYKQQRELFHQWMNRRPVQSVNPLSTEQYEQILGQVFHIQAELRGLALLMEEANK